MDMDNQTKFKNSLFYTINHLSVREKIFWILQLLLSITILVTAVLGLNDVLPLFLTNMIDLALLTVLFVLCGIKFIPERMIYAIIYFIVAALMCGIFIASFFIK